MRRVLCVRDQPVSNLTEASAYYPALCFPSPVTTSPAPHAGYCPFTLARAHAPAHLDLLGPSWDPLDAMDCSEDGQCGMDSRTDPPSSPLNMLLTQHSEEAVQEPHNPCGAADDLPVTQVLLGDHVNPARTHHPCSPTGDGVVPGQTWITGGGLVAEVAPESPMCITGPNPCAADHLSRGADLADDDGPIDTPSLPCSPRMHYPTSGSTSLSSWPLFPD